MPLPRLHLRPLLLLLPLPRLLLLLRLHLLPRPLRLRLLLPPRLLQLRLLQLPREDLRIPLQHNSLPTMGLMEVTTPEGWGMVRSSSRICWRECEGVAGTVSPPYGCS